MKKQQKDENSLLNEMKRLIEIRKSYEALQADAEFESVFITDSYPFVFKRVGKDESILICINPSDNDAACDIDLQPGEVVYQYNKPAEFIDNKLIVPKWSASYIKVI